MTSRKNGTTLKDDPVIMLSGDEQGRSIATRAGVPTIWVPDRDGTADKGQKYTNEMALPGEMIAP